MAAYCLPLLGCAAVLAGILLFIAGGCGKLFICKLCKKTEGSEEKQVEISCTVKCCSFSMIIINMIINLLTFVFCVWLFYSLIKDHQNGYDDLHSHKWGILAAIYHRLWFIAKVFCMYIFLKRLVNVFHSTPYAFSKCVPYTLMTIIIISFLIQLIPLVIPGVNARALKVVRLVRILFPLGYIIVMCTILCLYGHRYRLITKRRLSMPTIQNHDELDLQRIVKYSLMTNFALRGAVLVWIIQTLRQIFMVSNGNTETAVAFVICFDAMICTMATLFLFDFGDSLYFRFCMCSNDGYAAKCSAHNICNWFIRCCCCVPKMEGKGIRIDDSTFI